MILNKKPLSLADVKFYLKDVDGNEELVKYIKKFGKTQKDKSDKIKEKIVALNNPKIREAGVVKVIDFLPEDQEDVNKVFIDANLNEEEASALIEVVKGP